MTWTPFHSAAVLVMSFPSKQWILSYNGLYCEFHNNSWFDNCDIKFCYKQLLDSHMFLHLIQLVHLSPDSLSDEGIYQYMPSAHFVPLCQGWKLSATTTGLWPKSCYCPLSNSYTYITHVSQCFQQECKTTYRIHEPVASDVLVKVPLPAQRWSNCTK